VFCPQDELHKNSKSITAHQKASLGNKNLEKYLDMYYPEAKDFESFVILSQIMQSYALKTAIETHRSSMPKCMGTLYWQLNDCWPGISWSTLDYFGNWKASHYEVKRSFEPLIISAIDQNDEIVISVINDNEIIYDSTLIIRTFSFDGEKINEEKIKIKALNYGANQISSINKKSSVSKIDSFSSFLRLELIKDDNCISTKDHFFTEPKDLILEKPSFNFNYKINNSKIHLQVNAKNFLYKLHLKCKSHPGVFEDNFFEMLPNEQRIIEFYPNKDEEELPSSYEFELQTFYELVKR
jgi:beta-mannosidase